MFEFVGQLWLYGGNAGWHFVTLPHEISDEIDSLVPKRAGFGSVPVEVVIGSSVWNTSLFPDKKAASFVLPIKKPVRTKEDIDDGDEVNIRICLLNLEGRH